MDQIAEPSDLLAELGSMPWDGRHTLLITVALASLRRFDGQKVRQVAEYALEIADPVLKNAAAAASRAERSVMRPGQHPDAQVTLHRPGSALMQALRSGNYPQAKRKHRASDKALFSAMGLWLLCEGLKQPFGGVREQILLDASECIHGVAPLKSLGMGGTRAEWRDVLRDKWPEIIRECGPNPSAKAVRALVSKNIPSLMLPDSRALDNFLSKLRSKI